MESNQDVLNRIYANFVGNAKSSFEQTEEDFATLRAALASPPCVDVEKVRERIKVLMEQCGHANSHSIYTAFMQLANEFSQGVFGPSDAPADVGKLKEECKEALVRHGVKTVSDKRLAWEGLIGATIDYLASRNLIRTEPTDGGE